MLNIPTVTPNQALEVLKVSYFLKDPVMLHGAPGQGKTSILEQLSSEIKAEYRVITMTLKQPGDFVIPYIHADKESLIHYFTDLIPFDQDCPPTVIVLDELSSALPEVQVIAHEPLYSRTLHGRKIPDQVYFAATGNSLEEGCHTYEMGDALMKRLTHLRIHCTAESWIKDYAEPKGIAREVILFLSTNPSYLNSSSPTGQDNSEHKLNPCPRIWEAVSRYIKLYNQVNGVGLDFFEGESPAIEYREESLGQHIEGRIGTQVKRAFFSFIRETRNLPPMSQLFDASEKERLKLLESILTPEALYGLCYSVVNYTTNVEQLRKAWTIFKQLDSLDNKEGLPLKEIQTLGRSLILKKVDEPTQIQFIELIESPEVQEDIEEIERIATLSRK